MTTIGFIGSGRIGSQLARLAVAHGYEVVMSNSCGPETLAGLVAELGPHARAATPAEAAAAADLAVVTIPLSATVSELLQRHLPTSKVVKAFNHIGSPDLTTDGLPAGTPGRRGLVAISDDNDARATVAGLIDEFGFDPVELAPLSEGWRIQRDTPGYVQHRTADELRAGMAAAKRYRDM